MDGNARVSAFGRRGLARVDPDANPDIGGVRPRVLRERALGIDGGENCVARVREGEKNASPWVSIS